MSCFVLIVMLSALTSLYKSVYASVCTPDASGAGLGRPESWALNPRHIVGAFSCLQSFHHGGLCGDTFGYAGAYGRSTNLTQSAALSLGRENGGSIIPIGA